MTLGVPYEIIDISTDELFFEFRSNRTPERATIVKPDDYMPFLKLHGLYKYH